MKAIVTHLKNTVNIVGELYAKADDLQLKESRLDKKLEIIAQKENALADRANAVKGIESEVIVKQGSVLEQSKGLADTRSNIQKAQQILDDKRGEVSGLLLKLDEKQLSADKLGIIEESLNKRIEDLDAREHKLDIREVSVRKENEVARLRRASVDKLEESLNKDRVKLKKLLKVANVV